MTTLEGLMDRADAGGADSVALLDEAIPCLNALMDEATTMEAYLYCRVSTNSRDEEAQAKLSILEGKINRLGKAQTRFTAWIGTQNVDALLAGSQAARDHEFALRKAKTLSEHLMSPVEEALASDLLLSGGLPWAKLHANVCSQLKVPVDLPSGTAVLPMSAVRNLAYDSDRAVRAAAYNAELAAWEQTETTLAACMNGVKGEMNTLGARRGWKSALETATFQAHIDEATLDAMMSAARKAFPDFRRYLNAKAKAIGLEKLAWYDLFAPLSADGKKYPWPEAEKFILEQFYGYGSRLGDYAKRCFDENWIDVPPAEGKVDGAYCSPARKEESRVLLNYSPDFKWVSTLAHELGHAYHNLCLAERSGLQRNTPMTLAETASIFCETIVKRAVLKDGDESEKLAVLEASLMGATQVCVDITSRFLFEKGVFEKRTERELSPREMSELMREAQLQTYGDGLDPDLLHPYMWAAKPHYYAAGSAYYNFPYMFGLLFGLGLYSVFQKEPEGFHARYDDLLSSTGLADAATLAQRFGIDLRSEEFWAGSLDQIRADVDQFVALVEG